MVEERGIRERKRRRRRGKDDKEKENEYTRGRRYGEEKINNRYWCYIGTYQAIIMQDNND